MEKRQCSKIFITLLCAVFAIIMFPITAKADMGPKPSLHIQLKNVGDELCYGTLLTDYSGYPGSADAWDGTEKNAKYRENKGYSYADFDYATWKAFVDYKDPDGYYFLQEGWTMGETKEIGWPCYPSSFKVLLYYPETGTFVSSEICEAYAFNTYYTVDMGGIDMSSAGSGEATGAVGQLKVYRSYNYLKEAQSLISRIVITILIEMAVALLFRFRKKKQLVILAIVNTVTQIILNVLLNIVNYNSGPLAFALAYAFFEVIVFVVEAILYCTILKKASEEPKDISYYVLYAYVANVVSFGVGLCWGFMMMLFTSYT